MCIQQTLPYANCGLIKKKKKAVEKTNERECIWVYIVNISKSPNSWNVSIYIVDSYGDIEL